VSGEVNYSIKDALKISARVYDETNGEYFVQNENGFYQYRKTDEFETAQLKLNEVRLMAPLNYWGLSLNIYFEFDGIIEVISEEKDVQFYFKDNASQLIDSSSGKDGGESYGFEHKILYQGFISFTPLGPIRQAVFTTTDDARLKDYYLGREYYLNVNAYKIIDEQQAVIRARLKLVQLEDKTMLGDKKFRSSCFSIELISYEYSDIYKIMYEIDEDDE